MDINSVLISEWDRWKASYDAEIAKLYEAAKKESQVVLYNNESKVFQDNFPAEFNKHYPGITLYFVNEKPSKVIEKIKTEQDTGMVLADWLGGAHSLARVFCQDDGCEAYVPPAVLEPGVEWIVDPLVDKGVSLALSIGPCGMMINSDLVPSEKIPRFYKDLLDPWWKGKIVMADTRIPGGENAMFFAVKRLYGLEFWEEFYGEIQPALATGVVASLVAEGKYYACIGLAKMDGLADLEGKPIVWYPFEEGCAIVTYAIALVKGAPHPNATKLLLNYIFSKEGQAMMAKYALRPPLRRDVHPDNPLCDYTGVRFLPAFTVEEDLVLKPQARGEAKEIMAKYGYEQSVLER